MTSEFENLYQLLYSVNPTDPRADILLAIDKALMILDYLMEENHEPTI